MAISKLPTTGLIHANVSDKVDELVDFVNLGAFDSNITATGFFGGGIATPEKPLHVVGEEGETSTIPFASGVVGFLENDGNCFAQLASANGLLCGVIFGDANTPIDAYIRHDNGSGSLSIRMGGAALENAAIVFDSNQNVSIPNGTLTVRGAPVASNISGFFDIEAANGGTILPGNTNVSGDFTVTGAAVGDAVVINIEPSLLSKIEAAGAEFDVRAVVTAPNTVRGYFRTNSFITLSVGEGANVKVIK